MNKFLTIELDDINSVPKVYYKDEEITDKVRIDFSWKTKGNSIEQWGPCISIEYYIKGEKGIPNLHTIQSNQPIEQIKGL
ncbi:hypothetical protein [Priestia megaterium]|uniref:hypothetical protein n=1 Tax=Priestia TaxID=2800373 RepID=UPI000D51F4BD|nr:hypothetical protein [Priestia megaterium]PVE74437.1 hypothetical protein DC428_00575 [Priestia megaterium]PVE82372.1 hypothetical protein DC421_19765 [Priestia megaterium]PVE86958.1 hypothetical protein DC426_16770 [Priestia megaterium]PVE97899.1 hypothetical protein DC433_17440 [Priestia megaterium]